VSAISRPGNHAEARQVGDRARHRRRYRLQQHVAVLDVTELVREHAFELVAVDQSG
jgi:hypothetical protein